MELANAIERGFYVGIYLIVVLGMLLLAIAGISAIVWIVELIHKKRNKQRMRQK